MKLESIDLIFHYEDNETGEKIVINGDVSIEGWSQWGESKERLAENVELIESINKVTHEMKEV